MVNGRPDYQTLRVLCRSPARLVGGGSAGTTLARNVALGKPALADMLRLTRWCVTSRPLLALVRDGVEVARWL